MRRLHTAFLLFSVGLGACQMLVGIGSRDEAERAPREASVVDVPPVEASIPTLDDASSPDSAADATAVDAGCGIGLTLCGSACVDLNGDESNCGECGHGCLGAKCSMRACQREPVDSGSLGPFVFLADGELFYRVANDDASSAMVRGLVLDGGAERDLLVVGRYARALHVAGSRWLLFDHVAPNARIRLIDVATGTVERTLYDVPGSPDIRGLAIHGDEIYFTTRADVRRIRLDGTGLEVVRSIVPRIEGDSGASPAIDFTNDSVYFGIEDKNVLMAMGRTPKPPSRVLDEGGSPTSSAAYAEVDPSTNVLTWLVGSQAREVPLDGGTPVGYSTGITAHDYVREGPFLYVVSLGASGSDLVRIDLRTRKLLVLGTALPPTGQIAVDERYVYMATYDGGLYRTPR